MTDVNYTKISNIECLGEVDDYVYDISIKDSDPYFFANDILVHNTDSGVFSAYATMSKNPAYAGFEWTKENVVELYDEIGNITNQSFPDFMKKSFNCPEQNGRIIRAARELCGTKGLFITKKRYAIMVYDKDGKRKDTNGKPGEIKVMGLDLKRSDTPTVVQNFLSDILSAVLTGATEGEVVDKVLAFRKEFRAWPGWLKGSPKRANKITFYEKSNQLNSNKMVPGHVMASINWNKLKKLFNDNYSMPIQDGAKVVVCKLKSNPTGFTSVAYPTDEMKLPDWFKALPFDNDAMEEALIDKKVKNLLGVLKWKSLDNKNQNTFDDLFSF